MLWAIEEGWQKACSNYLGEMNNKYLKNKCLQFIKKKNKKQ